MPGFRPGRSEFNYHDQSYPSQIAAERPALVTRIYCEFDYDYASPEKSLRGGEHDIHTDETVRDFNTRLRSDHRGERLGGRDFEPR